MRGLACGCQVHSLSGALRPVAQAENRLKEAQKLGFSQAILPEGQKVEGVGSDRGGMGTRRIADLTEFVGEIFGAEDAVAEQVAEIEALETQIEESIDGTALVLSVSGGEYGAFGEGSRFGYFFDELGFTPAVAAAELPGAEGSPHGDTVTNEFLLSANPEWIIVFDRGAAIGDSSSASETLDNELVAQTTAGAEDQIIELPASELYIVINGLTAIENVLTTVGDELTA